MGESLLPEYGLDLLAWYRSFHVDPVRWGIYIREWGLDYLSRTLGGRRSLALRALWAHEYCHFLTDVAATTIEESRGVAVYLPYLAYDHRVAARCQVDEALANAYSLANVGRRHGKRLLRDLMRRQPAGYRDFDRYEPLAGEDRLGLGYREVAAHLIDLPRPCRFAGTQTQLGELLFDETARVVTPGQVPIYFVPRTDQRLFPVVRLVTSIPAIDETKRFEKELARLPRHVRRSWSDVKTKLARSTRDSGVKFEKVNGPYGRFSVRLSLSRRAILERRDGQWTAIAIRSHDAYRRAAR